MDDIQTCSAVQVEMVIVSDDCASPNKRNVGRRGIAGTVFVHKVAAACRMLKIAHCMQKATPHFLIKLMLALRRAHVVWGLSVGKVLWAKLSYQQILFPSFLHMHERTFHPWLAQMHRWPEQRLRQA